MASATQARLDVFLAVMAFAVLVGFVLLRSATTGGATADAQLDAVSLAAPVAEGEQVVVPARGAVAAEAASAPAAHSWPSAPLGLNAATAEQLVALPGIGVVTAQKILDYRQAHGPFQSVAELGRVPGIGQGKLTKLTGLVIP